MHRVAWTTARAHAATVQLKWSHIHSHIGQPWNEMADTVAAAASRGLTSCLIPPWDGLRALLLDKALLRGRLRLSCLGQLGGPMRNWVYR